MTAVTGSSAAHLRELSDRWKNFDIDQERARKAMKDLNAEDEEQIRRLHAGIARREEAFVEEWGDRRNEIREARDQAIKDMLKDGSSQAEVMRVMGNSNSQLVSRLYKEALLEKAEEARGEGVKSAEAPPRPDTQIDGVVWRSHLHTGVHGWLLSEDGALYKRYDTSAEEPSEAEWYAATVDGNEFIAGSRDYYDRAGMPAVKKRLGMLEKLLAGTYEGRISPKPSPYTA